MYTGKYEMADMDENKRDFSGWVLIALIFGFWFLVYKGIQLCELN